MNSTTMPDKLEGESAWVGADLANNTALWLRQLSHAEIDELVNAAHQYLNTGKDIGEITRDDFKIPVFGQHLANLKQKLLHGNGLEVIRGLPVTELSVTSRSLELSACIFCGIGSHIGSARSQNADGHILGHVRDLGLSSSDPNSRIYQTSERQSFHTDSADVVGLLCLKKARSGGESLLVSALSIYNRFKALRPDLLPKLFEPIATDRRGEVPAGEKPFMTIPVFSWYRQHLTVFYQRQYIDSAQRFEDAPRLTEQQIEALDLFDSLADDPSLHFSMQLEPGDMQFVYNHSQLHDRTGFEDWPELTDRRHLLRLWLSVEGDRPLPECFRQRYGSIEIGKRGGIITGKTRLNAPLSV